MKNYLVFIGDDYYPSAAMGDFKADFTTKTAAKLYIGLYSRIEAKDYCETMTEYWDIHWARVYSLRERKVVWHKPYSDKH